MTSREIDANGSEVVEYPCDVGLDLYVSWHQGHSTTYNARLMYLSHLQRIQHTARWKGSLNYNLEALNHNTTHGNRNIIFREFMGLFSMDFIGCFCTFGIFIDQNTGG